MVNFLLAWTVAFGVGGGMAWLGCDGCLRDPQPWGAANEVWTYVPGAGDDDGHCLDNCNYDRKCKFTGTIAFHNGAFPAGGGPRDLYDNEGKHLTPGGPIAVGGGWGPAPVDVKAPCGAEGEAAESYTAKGAAGVTSAFRFLCTGCYEDV